MQKELHQKADGIFKSTSHRRSVFADAILYYCSVLDHGVTATSNIRIIASKFHSRAIAIQHSFVSRDVVLLTRAHMTYTSSGRLSATLISGLQLLLAILRGLNGFNVNLQKKTL